MNDVAAMQALFPVVVSAAQTLGVDADLVTRLKAAIAKIRPLPRTDVATKSQVLTPSSDAAGNDMFAISAQPTAAKHNQENDELEPVWPYNLIGDSGSQSDLAKRTFAHRGNVTGSTWSYDSLHAARLGRGDDMRTAMIANIGKYQVFPSGLASWNAKPTSPYLEEQGVIAAALSEGLVQNYDGTLRIAPGWPTRPGTPTAPSTSSTEARPTCRSATAQLTTVAVAGRSDRRDHHSQPVARAERAGRRRHRHHRAGRPRPGPR